MTPIIRRHIEAWAFAAASSITLVMIAAGIAVTLT